MTLNSPPLAERMFTYCRACMQYSRYSIGMCSPVYDRFALGGDDIGRKGRQARGLLRDDDRGHGPTTVEAAPRRAQGAPLQRAEQLAHDHSSPLLHGP